MDATITNFVTSARQYCDLIAGAPATSNAWVFANECLQSVLRLYGAGLALPEREPGSWRRATDRIGHLEWQAIRTRIGARLSRDLYWEVFDPLETEAPEPLAGSICDDLADIWRDVQAGLQVFDEDLNAAIWAWRFSMETHWGHHAANAATALTALCFGPHSDAGRP